MIFQRRWMLIMPKMGCTWEDVLLIECSGGHTSGNHRQLTVCSPSLVLWASLSQLLWNSRLLLWKEEVCITLFFLIPLFLNKLLLKIKLYNHNAHAHTYKYLINLHSYHQARAVKLGCIVIVDMWWLMSSDVHH